MLEPEAHECRGVRQHVLERIVRAANALHTLEQPDEALLEQLVDQTRLVPEVVLDRRDGVPAARGHTPHGEAFVALLDEDGLSGVQNRATRLAARLAPPPLCWLNLH